MRTDSAVARSPEPLRPRDLFPTLCGAAVALLGVWLILSPLVLGHGRAARWNDIFVGVLVLAFGAMLGLLGARSSELSALLGVLAVWLIVSPAAMPYGVLAAWADRATGAAVLSLALAASPAAAHLGRAWRASVSRRPAR